MELQTIKNLKKNGIVKIGAHIKDQDILVGKIKTKNEMTGIDRLLSTLFNKSIKKDTSLKSTKGMTGIVTKIKIVKKRSFYSLAIYITEKRKIQIGDKMAGRHGNKGIVSKILPMCDMPYLQDGTPIDMILNPLGIPSRMNVGQIFECLLTLSAVNLIEKYKILPFDEMYGKLTSQIIVQKKLNEARIKTGKNWLFNPNYSGKCRIIDGRTGKPFKQNICIGYAYMLKLMHLAKDKINSRLIGPYSLIIKQPVRGKGKKGGQRFGEMEVWAMEGFGAAYTLQELLTLKSDDLNNRTTALYNLMTGKILPTPNVPESFKILILELQSLCLDLTVYNKAKKSFY